MPAERPSRVPYSRAPIGKVVEVALGRVPDVGDRERLTAISALARRDPKVSAETLERILSRRRENRDLRITAASLLRLAEAEKAEQALLRNLRVEEPEVRYRVIKSLGRVGGPKALRRLDQLPAPANEAEAKQLAFAKALIAYRAGIDRDDIPFVEGIRRRPGEPEQLLELRLKQMVSARRIAEVIDALGRDMFGIQAAEDMAFEVEVGRAHWTLLLNREAVEHGLLESLARRRWLLGLLALLAPATRTHSVQYVVLTKPVNEAFEILVVRSAGDVLYSGRAETSPEGLGFQVSDVKRRGTAPTRVEGRFTGKGFELTVALPFRKRVDERTVKVQSKRSLHELRRKLSAGE